MIPVEFGELASGLVGQGRMAEPEMVSAGNRPVTPGEMVSETLPTPQHLVLINNALPAINRGGVISVGNHVHLLTAVEFNNQRQAAAAGVRVAAYSCRVTPDSMTIRRPVPVIL